MQHTAQLILNMGDANITSISIPQSTTFIKVTSTATIPSNIEYLRVRFVIWKNNQAVEDTHLFIDNITVNIQ